MKNDPLFSDLLTQLTALSAIIDRVLAFYLEDPPKDAPKARKAATPTAQPKKPTTH